MSAIIGFVVGVWTGVLLSALLAVARKGDDEEARRPD